MRPPVYTVASDRRGALIFQAYTFCFQFSSFTWPLCVSACANRGTLLLHPRTLVLHVESHKFPFQNHILFYSKSDAKYILQEAVQPGHAPSRFTVKPYLPVTGTVAIMFIMPKRMLPQWHLNVWSTWRSRRISSNITMPSKLGPEAAERMKSTPPVLSRV